MQYSEKVMDHFTNPRNVGEIEDANGVGMVGNAKCGDIMKIYLKIDENDVIVDCQKCAVPFSKATYRARNGRYKCRNSSNDSFIFR